MLTLALVLLFTGLRGRRVDDHPLCRRCGFDLTGRPAGSTRCAECGADLTRRRAVRAGRRVRRRGVLWLATLLLLGVAVPAGVLGWGRARGVEWNRHKPAWWLTREGGSRSAPTRDAALTELTSRLTDGRLKPDELDRAVTAGLDLQRGHRNGDLPVAWARFIEAAHEAGRLDRRHWDALWAQAIAPRCSVTAEQVGFDGRGLRVSTEVGFPSLSSLPGRGSFAVNWRLTECHLNDIPWGGARVKSRLNWTGGFDDAMLAALPEGPVELRLGMRARLYARGRPGNPDVDVTFELRTTFPYKRPAAAAHLAAEKHRRAGRVP